LAPEEAKSRIHEYLLWQVSLQHMAELKEHGLGSPDTAMELRWVAQIDQVKTLEFVSVAVKRALFVPPFRRRTNFVVRVVLRDGQQQNQTRYFWFNGVTSVLDMRETSRLAWYVPL